MTRLSKETGRPVWFLLTDRPTDPERWQRLMHGVHAARAKAAQHHRPGGGPAGRGDPRASTRSLNPFSIRPSYRALDTAAGRRSGCARMRDPAVRASILAEAPSEAELHGCRRRQSGMVATRWDRMYVMGDPPDYEPTAEKSIAAMAARGQPHAGRSRLRLPDRGAGPVPVLPDRRLRATATMSTVRDMLTDRGDAARA